MTDAKAAVEATGGSRRGSKTRTSVTVDRGVLAEAKAAGLNLSQTLERALIEVLRRDRARRWREDSAAAIHGFNARIERDGVFASGDRRF